MCRAVIRVPEQTCDNPTPHRAHEWLENAALRRECRGVPFPGQQLRAVATDMVDTLLRLAAYGMHDSRRPDLREYALAAREAIAAADRGTPEATLENVRVLLPYLGGHAELVRRVLDGEDLRPDARPLSLAVGRIAAYCGRVERPHGGHVWNTSVDRWCPGDEVPGRPEPRLTDSGSYVPETGK